MNELHPDDSFDTLLLFLFFSFLDKRSLYTRWNGRMIVRYTRAFRRYENIYLGLKGFFKYHNIESGGGFTIPKLLHRLCSSQYPTLTHTQLARRSTLNIQELLINLHSISTSISSITTRVTHIGTNEITVPLRALNIDIRCMNTRANLNR